MNHKDKNMVSFDIKSLLANVPVGGAMPALSEVLNLMGDVEPPVPKDDYLGLVELCIKFGSFEFQGDEYVQINGLAMGSPLSAVLADLYMEMLEKEHFLRILGDGLTVFRYVDDTIAFIPKECDTGDLLKRLNEVEPHIQFTYDWIRRANSPF